MGKVLSKICFPVCSGNDQQQQQEDTTVVCPTEAFESDCELFTPVSSIASIYDLGPMLSHTTTQVREVTPKCCGCTDRFAMKIVTHKALSAAPFDFVQNEVQTLYELDHPNIIKLFGAYKSLEASYLVLEKCSEDLIETMSEQKARQLSYRLLLALAYLHKRKIIHLDVKPQNVMMKGHSPADLKLIDFGYAYNIQSSSTFYPRGTRDFRAPEVEDGACGAFSDIWSFGVTVYYWISGQMPFSGWTREEIYAKSILGRYDLSSGVWASVSDSCKDFLLKIFMPNPMDRLTAADALDHPWISGCVPAPPLISVLDIIEKLNQYNTHNAVRRLCMRKVAEVGGGRKMHKLVDAFHVLDPLHVGAITVAGLRQLCSLSEPELCEIVSKFQSPVGYVRTTPFQISCADFIAAIQATELVKSMQTLQLAFFFMDPLGKSFLTAIEIFNMSSNFGLSIKPKQIVTALKEFHGLLDWDSFTTCLSANLHLDHENSTDSEGVIALCQSHSESSPRHWHH